MELALSHIRNWLIRALVSLFLITWLLHWVDISSVWSTVSRLDVLFYFLMLTLYGLGVVAGASKWRLLLPKHPLRILVRVSLVGQFYSVLLPGQVAGEVMKAYRLGQGRRDAEQIAASVVVDKITGLLALMLLGFLGLYLGELRISRLIVDSLLVIFLGGIAMLFALRCVAFFELLQRLTSSLEKIIPILHFILFRIRFILLEWRSYAGKPVILLASLLMGLLVQSVYLAIILSVSTRYDIFLSPFSWLWVFTLVSLAVILPLSLGGIGVREGAFVGLLGLFDIGAPAALALSLTIFSFQLVAAGIGAIFEIGRRYR